MSVGLKGNADGSGAIQVGGTDAITLSTALDTTLAGSLNAPNTFAFKNRLINGEMDIDQRNAGASVTGNNAVFGVDRFRVAATQSSKFTMQQNAGSVTPPAGFSNYLGITSSSAYSVLTGDYFLVGQPVEGFNTSDLAFGTASAATITLSFWVRSSLTGTFGGSINNSAYNRSYPFSYTISAANTWEQKSITIAGDTTGTWIGATNGVGLYAWFNLGTGSTGSGTAGAWSASALYAPTGATSVVGTNGATFYITGVQLEKGRLATSFDYRPYGTELSLCQRYYFKIQATGDLYPFGTGYNSGTTTALGYTPFPVPLRANPTAFEQSGTAAHYKVRHGTTETVCSSIPVATTTSQYSANTTFTVASGLTAGQGSMLWSGGASAYLAWSAEL
jgi:hypothetical protein